jgi:predicted transcriptional regulator
MNRKSDSQPRRAYTSKHKSKTPIFSPTKSNNSDVIIFVEDVEEFPTFKKLPEIPESS